MNSGELRSALNKQRDDLRHLGSSLDPKDGKRYRIAMANVRKLAAQLRASRLGASAPRLQVLGHGVVPPLIATTVVPPLVAVRPFALRASTAACTLASLLAVGLFAAFAAQDAGFRSGRESAAAGCIGCPAAHRHAVQTEEQGRGDYYTCVHPGRRGTVAQHPSQLAPALARSSRAVLLSVDKSNGR
jgi:hypothetical protein